MMMIQRLLKGSHNVVQEYNLFNHTLPTSAQNRTFEIGRVCIDKH